LANKKERKTNVLSGVYALQKYGGFHFTRHQSMNDTVLAYDYQNMASLFLWQSLEKTNDSFLILLRKNSYRYLA